MEKKTKGNVVATELGESDKKRVMSDQTVSIGQGGDITLLIIADNEPLAGTLLHLLSEI